MSIMKDERSVQSANLQLVRSFPEAVHRFSQVMSFFPRCVAPRIRPSQVPNGQIHMLKKHTLNTFSADTSNT